MNLKFLDLLVELDALLIEIIAKANKNDPIKNPKPIGIALYIIISPKIPPIIIINAKSELFIKFIFLHYYKYSCYLMYL